MDLELALVDREILATGAAHDLRGASTTLGALAELRGGDDRFEADMLGLARARVDQVAAALVGGVGAFDLRPREACDLAGGLGIDGEAWALLSASPAVLTRVLVGLPHRLSLAVGPDDVSLVIDGLPLGEIVPGWNLAQALRWLSEGGAGFAGARLRAALRILGASRQDVQRGAALAPTGRLVAVFDAASRAGAP